LWELGCVNSQTTIRRMLSILMIVGLALAPLSRPAMAEAYVDANIALMDETVAAAMPEEMTGDIPCCPSKVAAPIGCDKCVFMAACIEKCFAGVSEAALEPILAVTGSLLPPQNDFWPDGLGHPPPDHPPRALI
jgi:hypothetical protein